VFRITNISLLAIASIGLASAGQIQVGGTNGLTSTYIASGCSGSTCVAGTTASATEQNYDNVLFSGAVNGATAPTPYAGYSTSTANAGTITDSAADGGAGVTFSMIDNGTTSGASNNYWSLLGTSAPTVVVPIGVFGVTDVWTMLNTYLAQAATTGNRDLIVTFNFGTTSNATTTQAVKVVLQNTNNSATASGSSQNAVDCTPVTGACGGVASPASGSPLSSQTIANTQAGGSGSVLVESDQVFASAYTSASGAYSGSTGSIDLNDQGFFFNSGISLSSLGAGDNPLNTYLVSISIRDNTASTGAGSALSAITVDTVPEPSTVFLLLTGLGVIGFTGLRRRRA
jgi:hypothetical protein